MPDKRRVGMVLCAVSAVLMLAVGMVLAENLFSSQTTDVATDSHMFDGYQPAGMPD